MLGGERGRFRRWALIEASWGPAPSAGQLCLGGARPNCSHLARSRCSWEAPLLSPVRVLGGRIDGCPAQNQSHSGRRIEAAEFPQPLPLSGSLPSPPLLPHPSQPHSSSPLWWRPPHSSLAQPPLCIFPSPSPFSPLWGGCPALPIHLQSPQDSGGLALPPQAPCHSLVLQQILHF